MLMREAAMLHTSLFVPSVGKHWWSTHFPKPSKFAASWKETAALEPFPAADTPMRTNFEFVSQASSSEYARIFPGTPPLAIVLRKHWRHRAS